MDSEATLKAISAVLDACEDAAPNLDEQLFVLAMAWMTRAARARNEALAIPGGFPAEQARQLEHLNKLVRVVEGDAPDLELERMYQENDSKGIVQHVLKRRDDAGGVGA